MLDHSKTELEAYSFYSKMSLSSKYKIITYLLLLTVILTLLIITGIFFFENNNASWQPLFPLFFVIAGLYITWAYSPKGVGIKSGKLYIIRKISSLEIPLQSISAAKTISNLRKETGFILRIFGSGGFWGCFGFFWSKKWGFFKLHITNDKNSVVLKSTDNHQVVVSPDDMAEFMENLSKQGISVLA